MLSTKLFLTVLSTFILVSCNTSLSSQSGSPRASFIYDKHLFSPGPENGVDRIMFGEGISSINDLRRTFSQYKHIIIEPVLVSYSEQYRPSYDNVDNDELKVLGEQLRLAFADAVRDRYPVVTSKLSPQTVILTAALTGVGGLAGKPGYYNMKSASIEAVFRDAQSGKLLLAVIDSRENKRDLQIPEDPRHNATNAFEWWAQRLSHLMDTSQI